MVRNGLLLSFLLAFLKKKSVNTQKKYIRDAITQRETRNWVQERKNDASTQRETKNRVQERKNDASTQRETRNWVQVQYPKEKEKLGTGKKK